MMMATSFLIVLILATSSTPSVATNMLSMATAPVPRSSSSAAASFLHTSCASVERANACYNLLLPYADSFHGSLARVARTSGTLAFVRLHNLTEEIGHLKLHGTGAGRIPDMVLGSCFDTVGTNDIEANMTMGYLDNLVAGVKSKKDLESDRFFAQNWFYSAASDMLQCIDWIHDSGDAAMSSPVLKEVITGCTAMSPYMEMAADLTSSIKFQ